MNIDHREIKRADLCGVNAITLYRETFGGVVIELNLDIDYKVRGNPAMTYTLTTYNARDWSKIGSTSFVNVDVALARYNEVKRARIAYEQ